MRYAGEVQRSDQSVSAEPSTPTASGRAPLRGWHLHKQNRHDAGFFVPSMWFGVPGVSTCPSARHNADMIPKPFQALLLVPVVLASFAPSVAPCVFALGLLGVGLWWLRLVLAVLLGD